MQTKLTLNRPEFLDPARHNRANFSCGVKELDDFLKKRARKEAPELSCTFVLTCIEYPVEILGYYSLSSSNIRVDDLPEELQKKLPRYDVIPSTLLGRMAVAEKYQHSAGKKLRLGQILLTDAKWRTWTGSRTIGSFGMIVHVLNAEKGDPTRFYERHGFLCCQRTANMLYLPMKTIEATLLEAGLVFGQAMGLTRRG